MIRYWRCNLRHPYRVNPRGFSTDSVVVTRSTTRPPAACTTSDRLRPRTSVLANPGSAATAATWAIPLICSIRTTAVKNGQQKLRQDPIVPEHAPCRAQRLDEPRDQGGENQRDYNRTRDELRDDIDAPHHLIALGKESGDGERKKAGDGT